MLLALARGRSRSPGVCGYTPCALWALRCQEPGASADSESMDTTDDTDEPADQGPYSPRLGDWRTANVVWVGKLGDQPVREPTFVHALTLLAAPEGLTQFVTPSASALHLNAAWSAARRARTARMQVTWETTPAKFEGLVMAEPAKRWVGDASIAPLFDYFEEAMLSAMSSYASIEAFCNYTLVEQVSTPVLVRRRKASLRMTAEEMERRLTTDDKLRRQVPDALSVPSPAGKPVWDRYLRLKAIRDSVTHFKNKDQARKVNSISEATALHELWGLNPFEYPEIAIQVIRHFYPANSPRWLNNPAWVRD
jgi:hypothetical protein